MLLDHPSDGPTAIARSLRNFCVVGTEPFELADNVAFAWQGEKMSSIASRPAMLPV